MIDIIAIITSFKGINLIVVIGVLVYLFKKKLVPLIESAQKKQEDEIKEIKKKQRALDVEYQTMEETLTIQKMYGQDLLAKIEQWNKALRKKEQEEHAFHYEIQKKSTAFIEKQNKSLTFYLFYKEVAPQITQEVCNEIEKNFQEHDKQQIFLDQACHFLKDQL